MKTLDLHLKFLTLSSGRFFEKLEYTVHKPRELLPSNSEHIKFLLKDIKVSNGFYMNDSNEKKPQLIDPPYHIELGDSNKKSNAPWRIVLENSPSKSEDSSIAQQQEDVELQQQSVTSTNDGNVAYPAPYNSPQQAPTFLQPNVLPYPTQFSVVQTAYPYPVQPSFAPDQYPYPTQPSFYSCTPTNFMEVELSRTDMQALKKETIKAGIDFRKKGMGLWLELEKQRLSNDEKMRYQKELDAYTDQRNSCVVSNVISTNGLDKNAANSITVKGVVKGFIADRARQSYCKGSLARQGQPRDTNTIEGRKPAPRYLFARIANGSGELLGRNAARWCYTYSNFYSALLRPITNFHSQTYKIQSYHSRTSSSHVYERLPRHSHVAVHSVIGRAT